MKIGQRVTTKIDCYDYKELIKAGTEFTIINFVPYTNKKGNFVYGMTNDGKSVRIDKKEVEALKTK